MREPHQIRHTGWLDDERVAMPPRADPATDLVATNRSLWREGRRWIPVSGSLMERAARDPTAARLECLTLFVAEHLTNPQAGL